MIGAATKSSRFGSCLPKLSKEIYKNHILNNQRKICSTNVSRGYVVKYSQNSFFCRYLSCNSNRQFLNATLSLRIQRYSTEEDIKEDNFIKLSNETLESLSEYFDELMEQAAHLSDPDVSCGDGVLTITFGKEYGTYVINRQVPNQQIWLSSPTSGPKRYDFIDGTWIYKHEGRSLHELLNEEIPKIVKCPVSFDKCSYGARQK